MEAEGIFNPTEIHLWQGFNGDDIEVEVENSTKQHAWRMKVNGVPGHVSMYYGGVYEHKGWLLATAYWDGTFPTFVPFRASEANPKKA